MGEKMRERRAKNAAANGGKRETCGAKRGPREHSAQFGRWAGRKARAGGRRKNTRLGAAGAQWEGWRRLKPKKEKGAARPAEACGKARGEDGGLLPRGAAGLAGATGVAVAGVASG
jgi:hypothetical protein